MNYVEIIGQVGHNSLITKSGNTYQEFKFKLIDSSMNEVVLTGKTIEVIIANTEGDVYRKHATILPQVGIISIRFEDGEHIKYGSYDLEIQVMHQDKRLDIYPNGNYLQMRVLENLTDRMDNSTNRTLLFDIISRAEKAIADTIKVVQGVEDSVAKADKATADTKTATAQANTARDGANTAKANADAATTKANTATTQANTARDGANKATTDANVKIGEMSTLLTDTTKAKNDTIQATTAAGTATTNANTAATNANTAKTNAEKATVDANAAKDNANTAATNANLAKDGANTAKTNADAATTKANTATTQANTARDGANTAATQANAKIGEMNTLITETTKAKNDTVKAITDANAATQNTNKAIADANTATTQANTARDGAITAKTNADLATTNANKATTEANTARDGANTAKTNADAATTKANTATTQANLARDGANTAATNTNKVITDASTILTDVSSVIDNLVYIGEYSPTISYKKNNMVGFEGSTYIAKKDTAGVTPSKLTNNDSWGLSSQRGLDGKGSIVTVNGLSPDTNGNVVITDLEKINRHTSTLSQGTSIIQAETNAIASVEIEGHTLVGLGNSVLETGEKYVIADKKTKVIVDGVTHSGVAKFTKAGETGRATVVRVANFESKVSGSVVENPHDAKRQNGATLLKPSDPWIELSNIAGFSAYSNIITLNGSSITQTISTIGNIPQHLFSFNLIEEVERNIGRIPYTTVADKVTWLKGNVAKVTGNWHGFGSSVGGNKASLVYLLVNSNTWNATPKTHSKSTVTPIQTVSLLTTNVLDSNGFVHFLAYAEPSNGTIPSVINTDYIELEIELKPDADFTHPKVPLYEVADESYSKILVDWDADEVMRRYPVVEGVQHLQGVGVFAEGDNLLPPFTEWALHANAKVISPYELEMTGINAHYNTVRFSVLPNQTYTIENVVTGAGTSATIVGRQANPTYNGTGRYVQFLGSGKASFTTDASAYEIYVNMYIASGVSLTATFTKPMLTLGSVAKPFVPRNPSYLFADVKLGAIGNAKDLLYEQDGRWLLRKSVERDVVLDGSVMNVLSTINTHPTFKIVNASTLGSWLIRVGTLTKFNGSQLKSKLSAGWSSQDGSDAFEVTSSLLISTSNTDSGFTDAYSPTKDDWKRYFNGWKYSDGITWTSVTGNGQTATVQVALDTKPTDYTPYKLSYVLATPQIIDVTDKVEGALKVNGLTQVEVMSGVIRREKVVPYEGGTYFNINHLDIPSSFLRYRTNYIVAIFKNGVKDNSWTILSNREKGYGGAVAQIVKSSGDYDPTAEYTVTYIALDKHQLTANPTSVKLTYAQNIRTAVDDLVDKVEDNSTNLSIHNYALDYIEAKADNNRVDLNEHTNNNSIHVTSADRTKWDSKADKEHAHEISKVTGLQGALDAKETTVGAKAKIDTHAVEDAPHTYGGKFRIVYNPVFGTLDFEVIK